MCRIRINHEAIPHQPSCDQFPARVELKLEYYPFFFFSGPVRRFQMRASCTRVQFGDSNSNMVVLIVKSSWIYMLLFFIYFFFSVGAYDFRQSPTHSWLPWNKNGDTRQNFNFSFSFTRLSSALASYKFTFFSFFFFSFHPDLLSCVLTLRHDPRSCQNILHEFLSYIIYACAR